MYTKVLFDCEVNVFKSVCNIINTFYYTSRYLFTLKSIVTSEANIFYCLIAVLPSRVQCYPEAYGEVRELT